MVGVTTGRVLVADDEDSIRVLCRVNLELAGYEVMEAADGPGALDAIRQRTPDAVLLDVMMPGATGWEVLREVRADPATASVPVIMLTALQSEDDQISAWDGGADEFLAKPFNPMALADLVERVRQPTSPELEQARRDRAVAQLKLVRELKG